MAINLKHWDEMSEKLDSTILIFSRFPTGSLHMQERPQLPRIGIIHLKDDQSCWTYTSPKVTHTGTVKDWYWVRDGKDAFKYAKGRRGKKKGRFEKKNKTPKAYTWNFKSVAVAAC